MSNKYCIAILERKIPEFWKCAICFDNKSHAIDFLSKIKKKNYISKIVYGKPWNGVYLKSELESKTQEY